MKAATLESRKECTINSQHNPSHQRPAPKAGFGGANKTQSTMNTQRFIEAYIECAIWATFDNAGKAGTTLRKKAYEECSRFILDNKSDLETFMQENEVDESQAGHSFFLSRNGHGAGFFDFWGDASDRLQKKASEFGEAYLYKPNEYVMQD